jgi:hypothetical protein
MAAFLAPGQAGENSGGLRTSLSGVEFDQLFRIIFAAVVNRHESAQRT